MSTVNWDHIQHLFTANTPYVTVPVVHTGTPDVFSEEEQQYYDEHMAVILDAVIGVEVASKRKYRTEVPVYMRNVTLEDDTVVVSEHQTVAAKVREWTLTSGAKIQIWTARTEVEQGKTVMNWAFAYASDVTFLVGGLRNHHPFVVTPHFRWDDPSVVDADEFQAASLTCSKGTVNIRKEKDHIIATRAAISTLDKLVSQY